MSHSCKSPLDPLPNVSFATNVNMNKVGALVLFNKFQSHVNRLVDKSNFLRNQIFKKKKEKISHTRSKTMKSQVSTPPKLKQVWVRKNDLFVLQSKGLVLSKVIPLDSPRTFSLRNLRSFLFHSAHLVP